MKDKNPTLKEQNPNLSRQLVYSDKDIPQTVVQPSSSCQDTHPPAANVEQNQQQQHWPQYTKVQSQKRQTSITVSQEEPKRKKNKYAMVP